MTKPVTEACGHPADAPRITIKTRRFGEVTGGFTPQISSIAGGRRVLVASWCRQCPQITYYRQAALGPESKALDSTRAAIADALAEVLAQPTDVFTLDLYADRAMNVVVPRHHLPLLVVESSRE